MAVNLHSVEGTESLKTVLKNSFMRRYRRMAMSMFEWTFDEKFEDMLKMTHGEVPEGFLFDNGRCCTFEYAGGVYISAIAGEPVINIYGNPEAWKPLVVGTTKASSKINSMSLSHKNSVLMDNNADAQGDRPAIELLVDMLIDNIVTMNQLQVLARSPFIFHVDKDNLLTVKNYYLNLAQGRPVMYLEKTLGDEAKNVLERADSKIDPSLFELFDRVDCLAMETLGMDAVPITKRAQQSVAEVESNQGKIFLIRKDKLDRRLAFCEEVNRVHGCNVSVKSVLDDVMEETSEEQEEEENDNSQKVENNE